LDLWSARVYAGRFCARIVELIDARADAYAAAALYEGFSRLSDAELERRGIPRGELDRCVFEALNGPSADSAADGNPTT
jgi:hypothetical protein